jgi:DNA polymerase III subunit gamma/tau
MKKSAVIFLFVLCAAVLARGTETVVLKGGKTLELSKPYIVRGTQALMTLKDGTLISVSIADIDRAATQGARRRPAADGNAAPLALSPAEAAKAQKAHPKAKLKIDDSDVAHGDSGPAPEDASPEAAEGAEGGDAKVEVVDFDQRPSGNTLAIKGTLRNSGKAPAQNVALSVSAIDGTGKAVASTNATVAAGSLEPGSSATFTASLPTAARASTLRFVPRWSSPAVLPRAEGALPVSGAAASGVAATAKPPAPPVPPPPPPAEKKDTYKPSPDYAPPAANAPMSAPDDNHTGYIPGAHEETPPPPPPPASF